MLVIIRLISLFKIPYKIIPKIIANRLKRVIPKNQNEFAFTNIEGSTLSTIQYCVYGYKGVILLI